MVIIEGIYVWIVVVFVHLSNEGGVTRLTLCHPTTK